MATPSLKNQEDKNLKRIVDKLKKITSAMKPVNNEELTESIEQCYKELSELETHLTDTSQIIYDWHDYFMCIACLAALRSADPKTKVGACIVNQNNNVVGIGYNCMPGDYDDHKYPTDGMRPNETFPDALFDCNKKYLYVVHAAVNAILNKTVASLEGCTIYLTMSVDEDCAHAIIQSGIKTVIYSDFDKNPYRLEQHRQDIKNGRELLNKAGITVVPYESLNEPKVTLTSGKTICLSDILQQNQQKNEDQPQKTDEEQPQKTNEEQPQKTDEEQPQKTDEEQPQKTDEEQPQKTDEEQPQKTDEEQPQKTDEEQPQKTDEEQPQKTDEEQPQKTNEEQPQKTNKDQLQSLTPDQFFMAIAMLSQKKQGHHERWPKMTQGACIVSECDKKVISIGHSGYPDQMNYKAIKSERYQPGDPFIVHAEYNAILAKGVPSLKGCTLYVTKYPCHGCAQVIVQAGISKVIFAEDDTSSNPKTHNSYLASKTIFRETNQHATEQDEGRRLLDEIKKEIPKDSTIMLKLIDYLEVEKSKQLKEGITDTSYQKQQDRVEKVELITIDRKKMEKSTMTEPDVDSIILEQ